MAGQKTITPAISRPHLLRPLWPSWPSTIRKCSPCAISAACWASSAWPRIGTCRQGGFASLSGGGRMPGTVGHVDSRRERNGRPAPLPGALRGCVCHLRSDQVLAVSADLWPRSDAPRRPRPPDGGGAGQCLAVLGRPITGAQASGLIRTDVAPKKLADVLWIAVRGFADLSLTGHPESGPDAAQTSGGEGVAWHRRRGCREADQEVSGDAGSRTDRTPDRPRGSGVHGPRGRCVARIAVRRHEEGRGERPGCARQSSGELRSWTDQVF